jgi:hypothetical protein
MTRAWPCGVFLQKLLISQAHALRVGYLKSMSSAIFTCRAATGAAAEDVKWTEGTAQMLDAVQQHFQQLDQLGPAGL